MRVVMFSLIDDWEIGPLMVERGHEILAWVRPVWENGRTAIKWPPGIRMAIKRLLAMDRPIAHVAPRFDARRWLDRTGTSMIACRDVNDQQFIDAVRRMHADIGVVAIYPQIFGTALLATTRLGMINYHPSLLPRYAGPQPAFWALRNDEKETGITIHRMTDRIDAGEIFAQEVVRVRDDENVGELMQRLHHRSAHVIVDTLDAMCCGSLSPRSQLSSERAYFGRKSAVDTLIDWNGSPRALMNLLRAVQPFEPLKTRLRGRTLEIFDARPTGSARTGRPGEILDKRSGHLVVQAGDHFLEITRYEVTPYHGWMNRLAQSFVPQIGDRFDSSASLPTEGRAHEP